MSSRQFCTAMLFATAVATFPRAAVAGRRHHHGSSHGRTLALVDSGDSSIGAATRVASHPTDRIAAAPSWSATRLDDAMRQWIMESLVKDGDNLGDRLAEGAVTKLNGWPAQRPLWILARERGGGLRTVRGYPEIQGRGEPVRLLLEDGVYLALADRASAQYDDETLAMPVGEVQRGNSFYMAVAEALFPEERRDLGIPVWKTDDAGPLRNQVAVFLQSGKHRAFVDALYRVCEREACWLNANRRPRPAAATPPGTAAPCPGLARETLIGPRDAKASFTFDIHVHDDVSWNTEKIQNDLVDWWLKEMHALLPRGAALRLRIIRGTPGIADITYESHGPGERGEGYPRFKGLDTFTSAIDRRRPCPSGAQPWRHFHLLLTGKRPYSTSTEADLGAARGYAAIACVSNRRTLGHELGHLLGATHAAGEVTSVGASRYCITAMREWELHRQGAADCGRYSEANRENIRRTLSSALSGAGRP